MKITIEIHHKTTKSDIDKLIKALQSVYQEEETQPKSAVQITKDQVKNMTPESSFEPISKVYSQIDIPYTKGWLYHQIYDNKISYLNKVIDGKKISCINKVEVEEFLKNHLEKKLSK